MNPYQLKYTKNSLKDLKKLEKKAARRVIDKLAFFIQQKDPLSFAKKSIKIYNSNIIRDGEPNFNHYRPHHDFQHQWEQFDYL